MVRMSCPEYGAEAQKILLRTARGAIELALEGAGEIDLNALINVADVPSLLLEPRATFITLSKFGLLRGCTGSLEPSRSLLEDVVRNSCHTAFHDPRFPPVTGDELVDVQIEISILSPLQAMQVSSEEELLGQLNSSVGLVIEDQHHRGTFLPKVWNDLPDPKQFLAELKHKAGLPTDYWSSTIRVFGYHTETFADAD
jgi:AmmeMemoRadiSam system protein A